MVVAVLLSAGLHVPVMPLSEIICKAERISPLQIGATCVNVGVVDGFTMISMVCVLAHGPDASGVKVYVVVVVFVIAGLQVPVMPLLDVVGKGDKISPLQMGANWVNVGVTDGLTMICIVCVFAHCPTLGVKV